MRLQQLDLVRYGKFTARSLDFGIANAGQPDFHLVYGPNEAGKSTLFSGFLDLLFGIERLSPYGFLHPYQTMRVGGIVETAGRRHHAYRIKRNANSLIGSDEQPLPDNLFSAALGSIDRATYRMMFSLDDESIEEGGESILRSEGELGSLLFSASSGLPDSSAVLATLRAEADAFYKPQGRKHGLAELRGALEALKAERNAIDINAREYASLRKTLAGARERHHGASARRAELRVARDRKRAQLDCMPLLARLRGVREELARQEPLPQPPSEWWTDLSVLRKTETEIAARFAQLNDELRRRRDELNGLPLDELALALAERFNMLRETALDARYLTAARDMPSRIEELAVTSAGVDACLVRLGQKDHPDPVALLLSAAAGARLQDLVRRHAMLAERLSSAREEAGKAKRLWQEAERDLARFDGNGGDLNFLAGRLRLARQSDCLLRQEAASREIDRLEAELCDKLDGLRPFEGNADELAAICVPAPGVLEIWRAEAALQSERRLRLDARIADESERQAGDEARLAALNSFGGAVDDAVASELRMRRDLAWQEHRLRLDDVTACAFETLLKEDDRAIALRLSQAERVAELRGLTCTITERRARLCELDEQRRVAVIERGELDAAVGRAAKACGLPCVTPLPQLEAWLAGRVAALETRAALRAARLQYERAASEEATTVRALQDELARIGANGNLPERLDGLLAIAERVVSEAQTAAAAHRAAVEQHRRASESLKDRETTLEIAEAEMAAWQREWHEALAGTWLAEQIEQPNPQEVGPMLAVLQDFDKLMQRKADLDHRISGMRKDQIAFGEAVFNLAEAFGLPEGADDSLVLFAALRDRIGAAHQQQERRRAAIVSIERMDEDLQRLHAEERHHMCVKQAMLDFFGCSTLDEAGACLDAVREQERLRQRLAELESDLVTRLGVATCDEAEATLTAVDEAALRHELARLEEAIEAADREVGEAHAEVRTREKALADVEGGDRVAELEQRRRTLLLDIENKALGYLRLRAGVIAAEQALRLFRERHRSAMMQRASRMFMQISGGEYSGLSTHADKGQEFLIANVASGGSKLAGDLSKGTRFQLYLALRIAGYHEVAAAREALPFIADDIMETFDDDRAGRAFELMAEMARVGQVIYLTHHEHLCDVAQDACPSVTIHRL